MRPTLLLVELLLLFVVTPLLYFFDLIPFHKSIPLFLALAYCLVVVLRDPGFDRSTLSLRRVLGLSGILVRAVTALALLIVLVLALERWNEGVLLFDLPRRRFGLWVLIMVAYPIWSAWPQELIYRSFFWHRYARLFPSQGVMILFNALLFSFLHIIFRNGIVLVLTFAAGVFLAWNYRRTRSLTTVALEHALLGNLVFTVGLGRFFYLP